MLSYFWIRQHLSANVKNQLVLVFLQEKLKLVDIDQIQFPMDKSSMHFTVNWLFQLACLKIKDLNKSVHFIETNLGNFKLHTHQDSKVLIVSTSLILIFASPSI